MMVEEFEIKEKSFVVIKKLNYPYHYFNDTFARVEKIDQKAILFTFICDEKNKMKRLEYSAIKEIFEIQGEEAKKIKDKMILNAL